MARLLLAALLMTTLAAALPARAHDGTVVVVVRHAEKASDDPRDPSLTDAGRAALANV